MALEMAFKALAVWLGILLLAIANGVLREAVLVPAFGQRVGLMLSGILLSGLIFLTAYLMLPWMGRARVASYLAIGMGWLCLTLVFEFSFGRIVQGVPWSKLLQAYRFKDGNLWPVVLLLTAAAPYAAAKWRGWA